MKRIEISATAVAAIEEAARAAQPCEFCGVVIGDRDGDLISAIDIVRLRNSDTRPSRFSIADAELRRARGVAAELAREVVAIVHSHTAGRAEPSPVDRASLAYSTLPWLIAGFDETGCYELAAFCAGSCDRLLLEVREDSAGASSSARHEP
ncbi:Mov34/MPN/PAD-1 family protein [Streptomyces sp. NPDC047009]|uniref:Mov34/MPN/PAD-1 family protein n=1 Tax=unclassified Streptomyces TaxID=2593676 RepID=UPI0033D96824